MFVGLRDQEKIEELTQIQKIRIKHLSNWQFLLKELFLEDIMHSLSVLFSLHNFLEVISSPKAVTFVIHWLLSWFHLMEKMTIKFIQKISTFYNQSDNCWEWFKKNKWAVHNVVDVVQIMVLSKLSWVVIKIL